MSSIFETRDTFEAAIVLQPPAAPSQLQASALPGQVQLSWRDNSNNEDGFRVRRLGPADAGFVELSTVGPNVTGYTDTTAQPNTTYTYRVRAFNGAGGAASNDAVVTTPAAQTVKTFTMDTRAGMPTLVAGSSITFVAGRFEKFLGNIAVLDFVNASASLSASEPSIGLSLFPGNPVETFQPVSLTFTTTADTPPGAYTVTINGVSAEDGQPYSPGRIPVTVTPAPKVVLDVSPNMQMVRAGTPASYEVKLQRDAFTQGVQVELSVNESRLPPGVRVSFDPPAPTGNRATMTVATDRVDLPDVIELRVRGRTPGVQVQAAYARLKIQPEVMLAVAPASAALDVGQSQRFDVRVVRMGYAGPLRLGADFRDPKPVSGITTAPADFDAGSTFQATVQIKPGTVGGRYALVFRPVFPASASVLGNEVEVPVQVNALGLLQLAADRGGITVTPGQTEQLAIGLSAIMPPGLQGRIQLSLDGSALPQGVSVRFNEPDDQMLMASPGAASLVDIRADALASGDGSFTVSGRFLDGSNVEVRPVTVSVKALATASVVIDFFGAVRSVPQGEEAAYTLLLKAVGYTGDVTLQVPDLPPGVPKAVFEPPTVHVSSAQDPAVVTLKFDTHFVAAGTTAMFSVAGNANPPAQVVLARRGTLDVTAPPADLTPPQLDAFAPMSGTAGTPVTLTGQHFAAGAQVTFNGVPATATVVSATRIDTRVPAGAGSGKIGIKTAGGQVFSALDFTVPSSAGAVRLSISPPAVVAVAGQRLRFMVGLRRSGYAGPVQLTASGLPPGAVASFSEPSTAGNLVMLDVQLPLRALAGSYTLAVGGSAPGLSITPATALIRLRTGRVGPVPDDGSLA